MSKRTKSNKGKNKKIRLPQVIRFDGHPADFTKPSSERDACERYINLILWSGSKDITEAATKVLNKTDDGAFFAAFGQDDISYFAEIMKDLMKRSLLHAAIEKLRSMNQYFIDGDQIIKASENI